MKLLRLLLRQGCTHRFSWPRIDENGRHYQICLLCGTAYEYDWRMMRRTNRLLAAAVPSHLHGSTLAH
ncbi:MAG TPA: hypothetical protein VMU05_05605 [Dongiaceae bacterium]|nr:hypothetical protein [Dongiaceae bacterium]